MREQMIEKAQALAASVVRMSHDGRGVAKYNDKVVFIRGALQGEHVLFNFTKRRSQYDEAEVVEILQPSPHRISPKCPHFGVCGGCALQYLAPSEQIKIKEAQVQTQLSQALGQDVGSLQWPAIEGPVWNYRRRARLSVKYIVKKQKVLVGFRERKGRYVAELEHCAVLAVPIHALLTQLSQLIQTLQGYNQIPQVEVAVADNATALVLRHLTALNEADIMQLQDFAKAHKIQFYLQPKGPNSIHLLPGCKALSLYYDMFDGGLRLYFEPTDFIQINAVVNEQLILHALDVLALSPNDHVLDLFCGLGNISLSVAHQGISVVAVEGEASLIERAKRNAHANQLSNTEFYVTDLAKDFQNTPWFNQNYTTLILDPPRVGALEVIKQLAQKEFKKILYISCNPATLVRDAGALIQQGYQMAGWNVADMFPHTHHVETMALFTKIG